MRKVNLIGFHKRKVKNRNRYSHNYWDHLYDDVFNDENLKYKKGSIYQSYKWK
ncbi:hypothetical protein [Bacillus sp. CECT 9360]|uniref:hypothetical protein n=1 Tax=Bacillus sp. CECT 9360 TaxID=2845821 RepID=UPI001E3DA10A|nr:hypothetical protein [Bacillus sp. CECT 9360]CAH0345772.1 hypothetical protein BCI9360_02070 [Bacillus sp. CECT 9360]